MMATKIEWTDESWNPVTGCTKISPGCKNCYAEKMSYRFWKDWGNEAPPNHFKVRLHDTRLFQPVKWKKPRRIFVCSMSDLFHEDIPDEFIDLILTVMVLKADRHIYQCLTKRPERMYNFMSNAYGHNRGNNNLPYPNVHLGVSVEDQPTADERIPWLLKTPAAVRYVSAEPLLEEIDLCLDNISILDPMNNRKEIRADRLHQVIVGAESGPGKRPFNEDWARSIRDQCHETNTAFFYKQNSTEKMPELDGKVWDEMP